MEYKGCYSSAVELIEEASHEFGDAVVLNESKFDSLEYVCEYVDKLVEKTECDSVDVSVDKITKQFTIEIACDDIIFENGRSNEFFKLIQMLDSFSFSKKGRESLRITLNIDNMWE